VAEYDGEPDPIDSLPAVWRPLDVVAGVLLLVPAFLLAWAGIAPLIYRQNPGVAMLVVSVASLWGAALGVSVSWRLIANRSRSDGGLVSPRFLKGAALLFAVLPIAALATGSWRSAKVPAAFLVVQALFYFAAARKLIRLAQRRQIGASPRPESTGRGDEPAVSQSILPLDGIALRKETVNPFTGTWIANLEQSRRHANHQFQSATLTFEMAGDDVSLTHAGVNMSGQHESGTTVLHPDGEERPVSPQAPGVVAAARWVGTNVLESEAKKDGRVVGKGTYEVSDDGRTLTATVEGTDAAGKPFAQVIVFDRE